VLDSPAEALGCALRETLNLGDGSPTCCGRTIDVFERNDPKAVKAIEDADNDVDRLYEAIKLYLHQTSRHRARRGGTAGATRDPDVHHQLEHIGDIVDKNLMELAAKKIRNRYTFFVRGHGRAAAPSMVSYWRICGWPLNVFTTRDIALARRLVAERPLCVKAEAKAADSHFAACREGRPESIETSRSTWT